MASRPLNEQQALTLFKESNTIIQARARSFPEGQTHVYVCNDDLRRALVSRRPFDAVRAKLRVVKILKPGRRPSEGRRAYKQDVLQTLARQVQQPNISEQPVSGPGATCYWLTAPYLGLSLKAVIDEQRKHKASQKEWLALPEMFLWRLLRDIIAGLAYLHAGVPSDYRGRSAAPASWTSIAHKTTATRITLDIKRTDEHGYPRAVLTDFGDATMKPPKVALGQWLDAKLDLEAVAVDFHTMAHGRKYRTTLDPSTALWCDCFTSSHVPGNSFLKTWNECIEPSVKLRNFLDCFCNSGATHHDEPLSSDQLLAQLNARDLSAPSTRYEEKTLGHKVAVGTVDLPVSQSIFDEPILGYARLPIEILDLLYAADFTNQHIRTIVPALANTTGYEADPHETFEHTEANWEWPSREADEDDDDEDEEMPDASEQPTSTRRKSKTGRHG